MPQWFDPTPCPTRSAPQPISTRPREGARHDYPSGKPSPRRQERQVTGQGPSSRVNARDLRKISPFGRNDKARLLRLRSGHAFASLREIFRFSVAAAVIRKNSKTIKIAKSALMNKYLQLLIFAKRDFFLTTYVSAVKKDWGYLTAEAPRARPPTELRACPEFYRRDARL